MSLLTQTNTLRGARLAQQTAFKQATRKAPTARVALRVEANKRVQKKAKVVLTSDVPNVGTEGQVTQVKIGYFRNWLYPQGLAKPATTTILDALRKEKESELRRKAEEKAQAQAFAEVLRNVGKLVIKKKAAESEKIFGSVSTQEVVDALLQATGRKLDKNDISLPDIKNLGDYECTVKLHPEVTGAFTVSVVKEKDIKITVKGGRR